MLQKRIDALIIFIKNPVKGQVKTRLAKDSGEDYALKVYLELQRHTMYVASLLGCHRYLYYSSIIPPCDMWDPVLFDKRLQPEGDLGQKMSFAFKSVLHDHDKAVVIGSDCIQLDKWHVEGAFSLLDRFDIVLGPALDGGYYLLGMSKCHVELFDDIAWSTDRVLDQTIKKCLNSGLSVHLLPELSDIDYLDDWEKYGYLL